MSTPQCLPNLLPFRMRVRTVQDDPWKLHQWNPTPPMHTVTLPALSIPNTPSVPSALDQWPHCLNKFNPPPPPPPPAWAGTPIPPHPSPAYYPHSYLGTPYTTPQRQPGTYPFVPIHLPPHTPAARPMIPPGLIPRYQPQAEWNPPMNTDSLKLSIGQNDSGSGSSPGTRPPIRRDTSTKGSISVRKRKNGATPSGETRPPVPEKNFPRTAAAVGNTAMQSSGASTATAAVPAAPSTQSGPPIYGSTAPEYVYTPISTAQPGSTLSSRVPQLRIPSPPTQSQSTATQSVATAANASNSDPQLSTDASNASHGAAFNAPTQSRTPTRQSPPATDTPTIQISTPTPPVASPQSSFLSPSLGTRSGTPQYGTPVQHIYAPAVRRNQSATFTPSSSLPSLTTPSSSFTPISFDSPQFYRGDDGWNYCPRRGATSSVQESHSGSSPQSAHISPVPTSPTPSAQPTPPPCSQNPLSTSPPRLQTAFSTTTSPRSNASSTPDIILQPEPPSSAGSYEFRIHAPSPLSPASTLRGVLDNPDLLHPHYVSPRLNGRRMDDSTPSSGGQGGPQSVQPGALDAIQNLSESNPRSNPSERDQIRQAMLASYENLEHLSASYEQMTRNPSPLDEMLRTPGSVSQNRSLTIHPVLLGPGHTFEWDMRFNPDELNITDEPAIQTTPGSKLQISCASNIPVLRYLSTIWGPIETSPNSVNTVLTDIFNFLQTPLTAPERRLWIQFKTEFAGHNEEVKRYYEDVLEPRNGTRRVDVVRGKMFNGLVEDEMLNDSEAGVHKFLLSL